MICEFWFVSAGDSYSLLQQGALIAKYSNNVLKSPVILAIFLRQLVTTDSCSTARQGDC